MILNYSCTLISLHVGENCFEGLSIDAGLKDTSNLAGIDDLTGPESICVCVVSERMAHTFYPFRIHKLLFREADIHVHIEGRKEKIWNQ